ncbi:MAG: peptidoglycan-binding protein [Pyrinomonadaceae bacterium]|nr:peptidoglycan-binding protein [Pyrinomonadaceae bacterium]
MNKLSYLRDIRQDEIDEARKVFTNTIDYRFVLMLDGGRDAGAMALCMRDDNDRKFYYYIVCNSDIFKQGFVATANQRTLIHELTHVWQGQHGVAPGRYMLDSAIAQLIEGVIEFFRRGGNVSGWGECRSAAYRFNAADIGKDWNMFNVEQQASIVESWYIAERDRRADLRYGGYGENVYGGGASIYDFRYPYISDNIHGNNSYQYKPVSLASGGNPAIKQEQDKLVAMCYLEARYADGVVGKGKSRTREAVAAFQGNNGLKPDGDMGTANSNTRKLLQKPLSQLRHAP